MAFWVVGPNNRPPDGTCRDDHQAHKRDCNTSHASLDDGWFYMQDKSHNSHWAAKKYHEDKYAPPEHLAHSIPVRNLAFLVIREDVNSQRTSCQRSSSPELNPEELQRTNHANLGIPFPLERTESGLSISSDPSAHDCPPDLDQDGTLLEDLDVARVVRDHITSYCRKFPDSQPERILRSLISPKSRGAEFPLDNDALRSIFSAANELFFASRLTRRVTWDWSHSESEKYDNHIVGTTALRRSAKLGGWETLIVLSSPILRDTKYNRRLLISTFLHEMIHSFMFVMCGLKAKQQGGHTEGFRQIAGIIDDWAGKERLHLRDMEADLSRWRGSDVDARCLKHDVKYMNDGKRDNKGRQYENHGRELCAQLPQRHIPQDWHWYEREDFGERLQHFSNIHYVSSPQGM